MAQETNKKVTAEGEDNQKVMPFGKQNYIIVLIGLALIVLGFILSINAFNSIRTPGYSKLSIIV